MVTHLRHLVLPFKTDYSLNVLLNISGVSVKLFKYMCSLILVYVLPKQHCIHPSRADHGSLTEPWHRPTPGALLRDTLGTYPLRLLIRVSWSVVRGHRRGRVVLHWGGELHGSCPRQGEFQQWAAGMNKKETRVRTRWQRRWPPGLRERTKR